MQLLFTQLFDKQSLFSQQSHPVGVFPFPQFNPQFTVDWLDSEHFKFSYELDVDKTELMSGQT